MLLDVFDQAPPQREVAPPVSVVDADPQHISPVRTEPEILIVPAEDSSAQSEEDPPLYHFPFTKDRHLPHPVASEKWVPVVMDVVVTDIIAAYADATEVAIRTGLESILFQFYLFYKTL